MTSSGLRRSGEPNLAVADGLGALEEGGGSDGKGGHAEADGGVHGDRAPDEGNTCQKRMARRVAETRGIKS